MVSESRMNLVFEQFPSRFRATFDDGYALVGDYLAKQGRKLPRCLLFIVAGKVGGVNDWDNSGELAGHQLMSWDQIIELKAAGAAIGSHGLGHLDLTRLTDLELERELKESKRLIEEKINSPVQRLAYPFGYFNRRVIEAAKAAGYKEAYTTCDSVLQGCGNPFRKRRIEIKGTDTDLVMKLKLSDWYDAKVAWELPKLAGEKIVSLLGGAQNGN